MIPNLKKKLAIAYVDLCMLLAYNKIILLHEGTTIKICNRNGRGAVIRHALILEQDLMATIIELIFTLTYSFCIQKSYILSIDE